MAASLTDPEEAFADAVTIHRHWMIYTPDVPREMVEATILTSRSVTEATTELNRLQILISGHLEGDQEWQRDVSPDSLR